MTKTIRILVVGVWIGGLLFGAVMSQALADLEKPTIHNVTASAH